MVPVTPYCHNCQETNCVEISELGMGELSVAWNAKDFHSEQVRTVLSGVVVEVGLLLCWYQNQFLCQ